MTFSPDYDGWIITLKYIFHAFRVINLFLNMGWIWNMNFWTKYTHTCHLYLWKDFKNITRNDVSLHANFFFVFCFFLHSMLLNEKKNKNTKLAPLSKIKSQILSIWHKPLTAPYYHYCADMGSLLMISYSTRHIQISTFLPFAKADSWWK